MLHPFAVPQKLGVKFKQSPVPDQPYIERQGTRYALQSGMELLAEIIAQEETVLTFL